MALKDLTEEDYKNIIKNFNTEPIPAWQSLRVYITSAIDEGRLDALVMQKTADKILITHVSKTSKHDNKEFYNTHLHVGWDRDILTKYIKHHYKIDELIKSDNDEFPHFADGGFRYTGETENWTYTFTCYPYEIIKDDSSFSE